MCKALSLLSRESSLDNPTAPPNFPIVERLVELLCRERGIAIPCGGVVVGSGDSSTGPREINSVFSNTQTQ